MKFSIGGYNIRNFKTSNTSSTPNINNSNVSDTYSVELYKHDQKLALIDNVGDGFIDITFEPINNQSKDEDYKFILNDMYNLLTNLDNILEEGALHKTFTQSIYTATQGFINLLLDLQMLVDEYDKVLSKDVTQDYYIVFQFGRSYFSNKTTSRKPYTHHMYALSQNYQEAYKTMKAYAERRIPLHGSFVAGAILAGVMDWNLSFQDYRDLYTP